MLSSTTTHAATAPSARPLPTTSGPMPAAAREKASEYLFSTHAPADGSSARRVEWSSTLHTQSILGFQPNAACIDSSSAFAIVFRVDMFLRTFVSPHSLPEFRQRCHNVKNGCYFL